MGLESLVSSKIRRALLEHILAHPAERFYLRGLAKELNLAVSPLRRELKRLERLGVFKTIQEGNLLFYQVQTSHPYFLQLKQAASAAPSTPAQPTPATIDLPERPHPTPREVPRTRVGGVRWFRSVRVAAIAGSIVVLIGLMGYVVVMNQRLMVLASQLAQRPGAQVTVVESRPAVSGQMQGGRWRVLPGAMGGFNAGANEDAY